jgi:hypothetical protein
MERRVDDAPGRAYESAGGVGREERNGASRTRREREREGERRAFLGCHSPVGAGLIGRAAPRSRAEKIRVSAPRSSLSHSHTHTHSRARARTHTRALSLSLSFSLFSALRRSAVFARGSVSTNRRARRADTPTRRFSGNFRSRDPSARSLIDPPELLSCSFRLMAVIAIGHGTPYEMDVGEDQFVALRPLLDCTRSWTRKLDYDNGSCTSITLLPVGILNLMPLLQVHYIQQVASSAHLP